MKLPILQRKAVERLWNTAVNNPELYKDQVFEADGELIRDDELRSVEEVTFDPNLFDQMVLPTSKRSVGLSDAHNALILFQELRGMTPKIARDERVWCALSHLYGKDYIWKRHIQGVSTEDVPSKIRTNFFCRENGGNRGFERDNALSQLWWWSFMASKVESMSHAEALESFLGLTDFRDAIVGRPQFAIIPQVFEALLLLFNKEKETDPEAIFFTRKSNKVDKGNYLQLMKLINRHGGRSFFDTMSVDELLVLFTELRESFR